MVGNKRGLGLLNKNNNQVLGAFIALYFRSFGNGVVKPGYKSKRIPSGRSFLFFHGCDAFSQVGGDLSDI